MENKIPPPLVMFIFGAGMYLTRGLFPSIVFDSARYISAGCFIMGALLIVTASLAFRAKQTTLNPLNPESASSLVTDGVFKVSRNPMYLAMVLILFGFAFQIGILSGLVFVPGFIAFITAFQILPEEEAMSELFGEDYTEYKARVRRWL